MGIDVVAENEHRGRSAMQSALAAAASMWRQNIPRRIRGREGRQSTLATSVLELRQQGKFPLHSTRWCTVTRQGNQDKTSKTKGTDRGETYMADREACE